MRGIAIILLILLISVVHAACSSNQIDINTASLAELDNLYGIGPAKAQGIIDARPFSSVDDLINAYGIGEATLEKIKEQDLACVQNTNSDNNNEETSQAANPVQEAASSNEDLSESASSPANSEYQNLVNNPGKSKETEPQDPAPAIKLNAKDIKTPDAAENKEPGKNYAAYGLVSFCVLLGLLFTIKKLKFKEYKNEFD